MSEAAIDTTVLQKANVEINHDRAKANRLAKRISLLQRIQRNEIAVLVSERLLHEYVQQIQVRQNDFVRAFFELVSSPDGQRVILSWKKQWSGGERAAARACRYPREDYHVLRTAVRGHPTTIYTEEGRMLLADACISRRFSVRIIEP